MFQSKLISSGFPFLAVFIVLFTFSSCSNEKEIETGLTTINLVEAYNNAAPINMSDFASDIEYIRLETGEGAFYKWFFLKTTLGDSVILMKSTDRISLFDRKTGTYLRDIGRKGDDPEGFSNAMTELGVNTKNKTVYAKGKLGLYEYSLSEGLLVNTIPAPQMDDLDKKLTKGSLTDISVIASHGIINDRFVAGYFMNIKGDEPFRLVVYDFNGEVLKLYPNHQSYKKLSDSFRFEKTDFQNYNNALFFKESFNDTVFNVGADTLKPAFLYELGKYSPPYAEQESMSDEKKNEYMFVRNTLQSPDFVFYNVSFKEKLAYGYYNRKTKEAFLSDPSTSNSKTGYTNDIDNFVPFYPTSINEKGEMLGLITAEEVYEWFQNNPDKIASLPENLQTLQNIEPEDNPVVMIAKLK
ncbi:uncharacterized protein DUF4934 [Roseivirga ehrenbergii]|uniref:Uncharacterized protein n=1 Tax=Roseivirga ehrenbergii (strain DSM 102268 / JCM 13514 / KCTC 12282 / NCIMB 14502 / KMM 6017) TaxID=279360 RepID=A0A150XIU4_ROSEK|nr:DUF4934 domain-containing protein [Roseivirga ehrenbergii]KYG78658.1 hypothetical protein MB14_18185 [Roseivirga ehrenbergii]TCL10365.1 uncharacterized protein DUF4934 [Roseivirga ehrenbergii]